MSSIKKNDIEQNYNLNMQRLKIEKATTKIIKQKRMKTCQ